MIQEMHEIWPIGRRGNPVYLEQVPEELAASLELLSEKARVARAALTVLAAHPNELHGPSELMAGIRGIFGGEYSTQAGSLHQVLREADKTLAQHDIILSIRKEPLDKQALNGNGHNKRLGWVWRIDQ